MLQYKEVTQDSKAVKEADDSTVVEGVVPFMESDFNLARGCQDVGAAAEDDDDNSGDIDLVRGGQDANAIMETIQTE